MKLTASLILVVGLAILAWASGSTTRTVAPHVDVPFYQGPYVDVCECDDCLEDE